MPSRNPDPWRRVLRRISDGDESDGFFVEASRKPRGLEFESQLIYITFVFNEQNQEGKQFYYRSVYLLN